MRWYRFDFKHEDTARLVAAAAGVLAGILLGWWFAPIVGVAAGLLLSFVALFALGLHLARRAEHSREATLRHQQDIAYLFSRIEFRAALPPLTGWAATPRLACTVYDLVRQRTPELVVEVGSGASTIVTAYALEQNGKGQVVSLEHDAAYAERVARDVARHGLHHRVRIVHAPLGSVEMGGHVYHWYTFDPAAQLGGQLVDLLVVDGPPHKTQPEARYPAVPVLARFFSADAAIVLDDAGRDDEQRSLERWVAEHGLHCAEYVREGKGIALLEKKQPQTS